MKKLRLIVTQKCDKRCSGCCNKQSDFLPEKVPAISFEDLMEGSGSEFSIDNYQELIITGGEPLVYGFDKVKRILEYTNEAALDRYFYVFLYTANSPALFSKKVLPLMKGLDGVTLTLHDASDYNKFFGLNYDYEAINLDRHGVKFRINAFDLKDTVEANTKKFFDHRLEGLSKIIDVKYPMEWIENCPLPKGEVLCQLK